ncbi:MAG TPA: sulfotransferase [Rhizomicrobium sp.]|nr:sulfotransferase [Rhizomicrobium sp.]
MTKLLSRMMRAADVAANAIGFRPRPLVTEMMVAEAETRAGRSFKDRSFMRPLHILLKAYNEEADLSLFGGLAVKWDIARFLANLLRLEEEEEKSPAILNEPVEQPIFITGLPRSGTTFLHTLLAQDRGNRVPLSWQTIYPYPLAKDVRHDGRQARVNQQFRMFERLSPGVGSLHPLAASTPQECTEITAHVFQSLRFDTTHFVPSYQQWLIAEGHLEAFLFHKRFLQHLQYQAGRGQWVLKCPDHVFTLAAIKEVYPDARFVFVHRDPLSVLPSVAKLTELLRAPFTRTLDRHQIGQQVSERWVEGAGLIASDVEPTDRIFHVHYQSLIADPVGIISALYEHYGMEFGAQARTDIEEFIRKTPRGGYGVNRYDFEDSGLDPAALREQFRPYMTAFGIESEWKIRENPTTVGLKPA